MINEKYGYIKGLSEKRRLPLLGKIRLGKKVKSEKTGNEYPKETEYFVVPDEVKKVYGEEPKEIDVMFPVEQKHIIFPTAYRFYGSSKGLKCIGNGETALEKNDKNVMEERECPCEKLEEKKCNKRGFLMAILPKVNMGGVYQISTGSFNSIIDVNSGLDYVIALLGRVAMVPLKLKRIPMETHHEGKKQTHYTLSLVFDGTAEFINQLRENTKKILLEQQQVALPAPKDENPEMDKVDVIETSGIQDEENIPEKPLNQEETAKKEPSEQPVEAQEPKVEPLPEGCHIKVIAEKIHALLKQAGFTVKGKKYKDTSFEVALINHAKEGAKNYSDLSRKEISDLYYELAEVNGDANSVLIPFE